MIFVIGEFENTKVFVQMGYLKLESTRSWKVLSCKVRDEIRQNEVGKLEPKLESRTKVGNNHRS